MSDDTIRGLQGCRLLVVEDEYLIAIEAVRAFQDQGATVLGPVGSVAGALNLIEGSASLDGALLDINLHGELVYPVVDALRARAVQVVFATGYDASAIPSFYADVPRYEKPINTAAVSAIFAGQQAGSGVPSKDPG